MEKSLFSLKARQHGEELHRQPPGGHLAWHEEQAPPQQPLGHGPDLQTGRRLLHRRLQQVIEPLHRVIGNLTLCGDAIMVGTVVS